MKKVKRGKFRPKTGPIKKEIGAETSKINSLIEMIHKNISTKQALDKIDIDQRIKDFVKFSFEVITTKKSHLIASVG